MNKLLGIRWSVHPLFVLIMMASVITGYFLELLTLFALVFVHELGHVLAARGFGWRIREVKLLPFGGVAETEEAGSMPAREEIIVALAGPLQNLWMGLTAWALGELGVISPEWASHLVQANLMIGLFNLLPVLPLDGGKIVQALMSCRLPYHITLVWGARISLFASASMIIYSLLPREGVPGIQMNLLAIGIFLFASNWSYYRNIPFIFVRFLMHREGWADKYRRREGLAQPIIVSVHHTIQGTLRRLVKEKYHLIYVLGMKGTVVTVLPEEQVVNNFLTHGKPGSAVTELFR
ncbi:M50 family metallopeptidase [Paenibacillus pinihumi]|uniref:M50 family metallopeptidase n=1 Tax=Paenibacillus pinihumi TaxID=669462 RepID=UPI0003FA4916|nr:M50 family metallopeptidase [Paenibacillus pinihumi]